ncbi:MAG: amidohydrolase family protein [Deltaproteobacteria bacterium]|nr:amidohydrolase family protein [Deltaproteobacteria bacterium]MBV8454578.1 amidohydrolase family protein [Deltaproteobacteria bacterium]
MAYDLIIRNGIIVDGTGAPRRHADVAIADGGIAEIGKCQASARRVLDASDLIVAPGFIDPHTHYDAQICWDPLISCSSWHGITTVMMGNCGVGIAPCKPSVREVATWDLVNVEAIPFEVLNRGITWEWQSFPEYMEAAAKRPKAINLGFLAPLTPFRHFVIGEESMERAATPDETLRIKSLLKEAVAAGAFGFSTTNIMQHIGYQGRPLACRLASNSELKAYCNALRELGKGAIEIALTRTPAVMSDDEYTMLDLLLTESARPVTWLALMKRYDLPGAYHETIQRAEPLIRRGAVPQISNLRLVNELDLRSPFMLASFPSWVPAFNQPIEAQKRLYSDPDFRAAFRYELKTPRVFHGIWSLLWVKEATNPHLKELEGRTVAEIAKERGKDGVDTFLDLSLEDDLQLIYTMARFDVPEDLLADSRTMIGLSDGGAHVDMLCDAGYCTELLGSAVREKQLMSLELAVKRLTSEPADFFGIRNRGRLAVGQAADIAIFDFNTVGSCAEHPEARRDLPGGGRRLVVPAHGVVYTIVNGEILYENQQHSGAFPGQVLRS